MLAELRRVLPNLEVHEAPAEAMSLADRSVDAVVCAQAFHWFDAPAALAEFARVIRPGGNVGLIWNVLDAESHVTAALAEAVPGIPTRGPDDPAAPFAGCEEFVDAELQHFAHVHRVRPADVVALAASWSAVSTLPAGERTATLDAVLRAAEEVAEAGDVTLRYVAHAIRASRR